MNTTSPSSLRLLSWLMAVPDDQSLDALAGVADAEPWLRPAVEELAALPTGQWQAEHTRLFVSGHPRTACPPFESAYRQGCMDGAAADDLHHLYRSAGLQADGMPADYLGTILVFAACLGEDGAPDRRDMRASLWEEHVRSWVPRFADDLTATATLRLYQAVGRRLAELAQ